MEDEDDTDLKLLRASDAAIAEIKAITKQLLGHSAFTKFDGHADVSKINHLVREMFTSISLELTPRRSLIFSRKTHSY